MCRFFLFCILFPLFRVPSARVSLCSHPVFGWSIGGLPRRGSAESGPFAAECFFRGRVFLSRQSVSFGRQSVSFAAEAQGGPGGGGGVVLDGATPWLEHDDEDVSHSSRAKACTVENLGSGWIAAPVLFCFVQRGASPRTVPRAFCGKNVDGLYTLCRGRHGTSP